LNEPDELDEESEDEPVDVDGWEPDVGPYVPKAVLILMAFFFGSALHFYR